MSVSTGSGSGAVDMAAVVNGGPEFLQRMADYQATAKMYQAALADLNLGKSAKAANDEAHRNLAQAQETRNSEMAKLTKELADARKAVDDWSAQTKGAIQANLDDAATKYRQADSRLAQVEQMRTEVASMHSNALAEANKVIQQAQNQADKLVSDAAAAARKLQGDAETLKEKAQDDARDAADLKAKYETALAKFKSAVIPD